MTLGIKIQFGHVQISHLIPDVIPRAKRLCRQQLSNPEVSNSHTQLRHIRPRQTGAARLKSSRGKASHGPLGPGLKGDEISRAEKHRSHQNNKLRQRLHLRHTHISEHATSWHNVLFYMADNGVSILVKVIRFAPSRHTMYT